MLRHNPINMNSKRSISLLTLALLDLMDKKDYKKISVSEITNHAGLVRSTFYAHFTSKEDIISNYLLEILQTKFSDYSSKGLLSDSDFIRGYFSMWGEQVDLLKKLMDNDLLLILNQLDTHFEVICHSYFSSQDTCLSQVTMKYANAFYADALASVLKQWVKTGMKESVEDLTDIFLELATYEYK